MAFPAKKERYTFADCLVWDEGERIEIINGETFLMAAPSSTHQEISMEISRQLANFLEGKRCRVYPAPFAVRLFEKDGDAPEDVDTVVESDISVVCDRNKIDIPAYARPFGFCILNSRFVKRSSKRKNSCYFSHPRQSSGNYAPKCLHFSILCASIVAIHTQCS